MRVSSARSHRHNISRICSVHSKGLSVRNCSIHNISSQIFSSRNSNHARTICVRGGIIICIFSCRYACHIRRRQTSHICPTNGKLRSDRTQHIFGKHGCDSHNNTPLERTGLTINNCSNWVGLIIRYGNYVTFCVGIISTIPEQSSINVYFTFSIIGRCKGCGIN